MKSSELREKLTTELAQLDQSRLQLQQQIHTTQENILRCQGAVMALDELAKEDKAPEVPEVPTE